MLRTALALEVVKVWWCWWGAVTGKRGLVLQVGVLVLLVALDSLLKAVDALHAGRKAVVISGEGPYSRCGMEVESGENDLMSEGKRLEMQGGMDAIVR